MSKTTVRTKSVQTVTDNGIRRLVDFITGDSNAPSQHFSGTNSASTSGAQIEIAHSGAGSPKVLATPSSNGTPTHSGNSATLIHRWRDETDDAYTVQSAKLFNGPTSVAANEIATASSVSLVSGTSHDKVAAQVAEYRWQISMSFAEVPEAPESEYTEGLDFFMQAIRWSNAKWHTGSNTVYAFLDTTTGPGGGGSRVGSANLIHNGTTDWTVSTEVIRNRSSTPAEFTVNATFQGPAAGTAVTGIYLGVSPTDADGVDDNPRRIIYGKRVNLNIGANYHLSHTFRFEDS